MQETFSRNCTQKIEETIGWISEFVVGLQICPFASFPLSNGLIRYHCLGSSETVHRLNEASAILDKLLQSKAADWSTSFILFTDPQPSFEQLLDLIEVLLQMRSSTAQNQALQLIAFHPEFVFKDLAPEDSENNLNRSPHAMIHVLREDEVTAASAQIEDMEEFLMSNREKMERLGSSLRS